MKSKVLLKKLTKELQELVNELQDDRFNDYSTVNSEYVNGYDSGSFNAGDRLGSILAKYGVDKNGDEQEGISVYGKSTKMKS